jgi:hypothetical protein
VARLAFRHTDVIELKGFPIVECVAIGTFTLEVQRVNLSVIKIIRVRQTGINLIIIGIIRHRGVAAGAIRGRIRKAPGLVTVLTVDFQVLAGQQGVVHLMLHLLPQEGNDLRRDPVIQLSKIFYSRDRSRRVKGCDLFLQLLHSGILSRRR